MNFHKAVFLTAILLILIPYVGDNDFWLHLRTGEIIVESGHFPRTDAISFTGAGREWINQAWLSQIVFYLLFKYGGFTVVSVFTGLVGFAVFVLLLRGRKLSWLLAPSLFLAAYGLKSFIVPRPQIFAYLALLVLMIAIDRYYRTKSRKIIFALPLILFFWGNFHGSVVLAPLILLLVLAFEFWPLNRFNKNKLLARERKLLFAGTVLGLGASLLNPFGYKLYWHAFHPLLFSRAYNALIETQPIYEISTLLLAVHLFVIFLFVWRMLNRPAAFRTYEIVLAVLFAAAPFAAIKYLPFSWVVILSVTIKTLPEIKKKLLDTLTLTVIITTSAILFFRAGNLSRDAHDEWPKDMIDFIQENKFDGNIYHPFGWSGYVAWMTKRPAFNNPTVADMGGNVFWDSENFEKGERVDEIIEKYDLSLIISPPWIPLPYFISLKSDWALVYWDNFGTVFVKRRPGNDEKIDRSVLDIKYFNDSVEGVLKKYKQEEIPGLIKNYGKAIERQPDLLLARYRLGLIYQLEGNCPKAVEEYKKLLDINHNLGSAHFRLAECYKKLGKFELSAKEEKLGERYVKKEKWWKGRR